MAFNINDMIGAFQFEGARPTLFNIDIFNPVDSSADSSIQFLASSTEIPASNLGNIPTPYMGRIINFAGDRTYDAWSVRVMNDENFAIRNALEAWSDAINKKVQNIRSETNYKSTARVTQFSKTGDTLRIYRFNGIYPQTIAPIGLDWNSTNVFESFNVTFMYDYWDIENTTTGNAGGL
jgi:hypothetical protein